MAADLTPFERQFMQSLPREITTLPRQPSSLTEAERKAMVRLQGAGMVRVEVNGPHTASVNLSDVGRAELQRYRFVMGVR